MTLARRHLLIGWWGLLLFLSLGALLEALHGFKIGFYLDAASEARRLAWRLAHAHGTLLSLVNIAFGFTIERSASLRDATPSSERRSALASGCLAAATVLIPLGFFVAGGFIHGGDPGPGILLVPPGALLLFLAAFLTARSV